MTLRDFRSAFGHEDAPPTLLLGSHEELQHPASTTANPVSDLLRAASIWINRKPATKFVSRFPAADYPLLATCSSICRNRIAVTTPLRHSRLMRRSILATFSEADALQAAMRAAGFLCLATTQKRLFRARFSRVTPDRLRLIAMDESLPRIAFVRVPLDRILVAFTPETLSCQLWNGMRTHAEQLIVPDSGASAHARTDDPSRWRAICLPKQEFARYAHALAGGVPRMPEGFSYWHTRLAALRELHGIHLETTRSVELPQAAPAARCSSRLARSNQQLHDCLGGGTAAWLPPAESPRNCLSNTVRRVAVAYLATGSLCGASAIDAAAASYRSVTGLTLRAVDLRIVGVQNCDHVRPSIETRPGKAARRHLRARC
jgi:hypothetical protein